jgi:hypothetical protein
MFTSESGNKIIEKNRREQMQNENQRHESTLSGIGWGLFFILIGGLFFADNRGWLHGNGWLYFIIGLGCICVTGFLVRYFVGHSSLWQSIGSLLAGLALIYLGIAFLNGFGDWWPLALIPIGIIYLVKGIWNRKNQSYAP